MPNIRLSFRVTAEYIQLPALSYTGGIRPALNIKER
jgi:hypothetical protein